MFVLLDKICKIKFKVQSTNCNNKNVTCISSPKGDLLKFVNFKFRLVLSCSCMKKDGKVFVKSNVTF